VSIEYEFYTEFQGHDKGFDPLQSAEISETIKSIEFLRETPSGQIMLTSNENSVRMFKMYEKTHIALDEETTAAASQMVHSQSTLGAIANALDYDENHTFDRKPALGPNTAAAIKGLITDADDVQVPRIMKNKCVREPAAKLKREYKVSSGTSCNLCSTSVCSDESTFLAADALRILLWDVETSVEAYGILDMSPDDMNNLQEVLSVAKFHPTDCSRLVYGTSLGGTYVVDLRDSALVSPGTRGSVSMSLPRGTGFYSEVLESVSDASFVPDSNYVVTRNYLSSYLWDMRNPDTPVKVWNVQQYLEEFSKPLHENDCIFDRFGAAVSPNGKYVASGSYDGNFVINSIDGPTNSDTFHPTSEHVRRRARTPLAFSTDRLDLTARRNFVESMDFAKKAQQVVWHPYLPAVAVASLNKVYVYQATK
jgi:serine/threonine-protein phosphatase 2A regulatory subunit B